MMAGRAAEDVTPGTYAFSQKQFIEPLADYLTSIRGPGLLRQDPVQAAPASDRCGLHQSRRDRI